MPYSKEEKIKRFQKLPPDLQEAILSVETSDKIFAIGNKHKLMLDQTGELADELNLLILGLSNQTDFVDNIAKRLEISKDKANEIATDINTDILNAVRISMRKIQEIKEMVSQTLATEPARVSPQPKVPVTPIEKAGDFELHRPTPSTSSQYNDSNLNREDVLADLENIKKLKPENAESYVEHLIASPAPVPPPPPPPKPVENPAREPQPQKKYETDPYREAI